MKIILSNKNKKISRLRKFLWFAEFIILLSVIENFIIRPYYQEKQEHRECEKTVKIVGEAGIFKSKTKPIKLMAATVIKDCHLSSLTSLAVGSENAQNMQISSANFYHLPLEIKNSIGIKFRLIPSGTFMMGSSKKEKGYDKSELLHQVDIAYPFYMAKFEITQQQWQEIMGNNPASSKYPNMPINEISWYDCQRFLLALAKKENVQPGLYRLPTEQEWEYACRAGTNTAFYCGNDEKSLKNFAEYKFNNNKRAMPGGRKLPNAFGLYNMHGNCWEWCADKFKSYDTETSIISLGVNNDSQSKTEMWRVIRGGNIYEPATACRSAHRCRLPAPSHGNMLGFRIIRIIPEINSAY